MTKTQTKAPKAQTKVQAQKKAAATPAVEKYGFRSKWVGPSDLVNSNHSRTKVDPARFNMFPDGNVTQRDTDAMVALRAQFKDAPFERRNCDAGILRRLMERGLAQHVSGNPDAVTGQFKLTAKGMGK